VNAADALAEARRAYAAQQANDEAGAGAAQQPGC
jgi:hypothetical protein